MESSFATFQQVLYNHDGFKAIIDSFAFLARLTGQIEF